MRIAFFACLAWATSSSAQIASGDVQRAWEARGSRLKSVEWIADTTTIYPKGIIDPPKGERPAAPAQDEATRGKIAVWIDGEKWRCNRDDQTWFGPRNAFVPSKFEWAWNGTLGASFLQAQTQSTGSVGGPGQAKELKRTYVKAIGLCYRPTSPIVLDMELSAGRFQSEPVAIGGANCVTLMYEAVPLAEVYYLDPAREFLPVRWIKRNGNVVSYQADYAYAKVDGEWSIARLEERQQMPPSGLIEVRVFEASAARMNPPIEPSRFDIVFPKGTVVFDEKSRRAGPVPAGSDRSRKASNVASDASLPWVGWVGGAASLALAVLGWRQFRRSRRA